MPFLRGFRYPHTMGRDVYKYLVKLVSEIGINKNERNKKKRKNARTTQETLSTQLTDDQH